MAFVGIVIEKKTEEHFIAAESRLPIGVDNTEILGPYLLQCSRIFSTLDSVSAPEMFGVLSSASISVYLIYHLSQ